MRPIMRLSRFMCLALVMCVGLMAFAQEPKPTVIKSGGQATSVVNNTDYDFTLTLRFDGNKLPQKVDLSKGEKCDIETDCYQITYNGISKNHLWGRQKRNVSDSESSATIVAEKEHQAEEVKPETKPSQEVKPETKPNDEVKPIPEQKPVIVDIPVDIVGWRKKTVIIQDFKKFLDTTGYYSPEQIELESESIDQFIDELQRGADRQYVESASPDTIVMASNLDNNSKNVDSLITRFLNRYSNRDKEDLRKEMTDILNERLENHKNNLYKLKEAVAEWEQNQPKHNWPLISLIVGIVAILAGLISWFIGRKKKSDSLYMPTPAHQAGRQQRSRASDKEIVVRRKTTSILKKQSLENVNDNPCYLAINCADFCASSAVRRIYIKNSCIKDIYNMYAEDLRNPENPKEDGCMILGRWVHDKEKNEYYVSLEEVVKPGDDAVFSEYELNFGGKIKLKVSEKLRRLRRETDLQYDMTCWVHSHPGLGVFFSNQDNIVHMQLKHPTHPHFLIALVIDILTPEQELGIFTFKPDGTLNSKADLTKMYSLEDMYKWAIESERNTFKREDHFDTLAHAKQHENTCHGVHLSNSAIIDIDKLVVEHENGMAGMVHGFVQQEGCYSEIAVSAVCQEEKIPDNELVGCFIITNYCSIPTVRKAIEPHAGKIRFALVYSTADGLLTTIPVNGRELLVDETYYGEQKLEELKIWTRRKR